MNQANQSSPYSSSYRSEIDGLRAFAILSVVAFHAFPRWLSGGFIGVDVFFVISGFLITSHIFENLDKGKFSFTDFFGRRIRRIFPALILVMACSFAFGWFVLYADEFKHLGKHLASSSFFITNFILVDESGYFDRLAETKPMLHLWSLAVEEQFYILWPLILWMAWKRSFNLLLITISISVISFVVNIAFVSSFPTQTFFYPFGRFWELLVGSTLAWFFLYRNSLFAISERLANVISFFGLTFLLIGAFFLSKDFDFPSYNALIPIVGAVLVIFAGFKGFVSRIFLMNPLATWFGLISYPLYLWHWPIFSFLEIIEGGTPQLYVRIAAIFVSIFLAWLTFRFVENPIRKQAISNRLSTTLIMLVGLMGVLGLLTYNGSIKANLTSVVKSVESTEVIQFDFPFAESELEEIEQWWEDIEARNACFSSLEISKDSKIRYCSLSDLDQVPQVALIGDSHSAAAFEGTSYYFNKDHNLSVVNLGGRLFGNVINHPKGSSPEIDTYKGGFEIADYLEQRKSIKTIVMVSRGYSYFSEDHIFSIPEKPQLLERKDVFAEGLRDLLKRFLDRNIIFVLENPTLQFDPLSCDSNRPIKPISSFFYGDRCGILKTYDDSIHLEYIQLVREILFDFPNVILVDPRDFLCDRNKCYSKISGRNLYRDLNHLNRNGSFVQGKQISDSFNRFKN